MFNYIHILHTILGTIFCNGPIIFKIKAAMVKAKHELSCFLKIIYSTTIYLISARNDGSINYQLMKLSNITREKLSGVLFILIEVKAIYVDR